MIDRHEEIAVIGGGLSGLACAFALRAFGVEPIVFDRGRLPGGRISSRSVVLNKDLRVIYDYGTPMIHVSDRVFAERAENWIKHGAAAWWTPQHEHGDGTKSCGERVLVGVPSMNSIIQTLCEGIMLERSMKATDLAHDGDRWRISLESLDRNENMIRHFDKVVLAMPAAQARRLIDPAQIEGCEQMTSMSSMTTWVCMMCLDLGKHLDAMPDIIDTHDGDRIVLSHRRPGRALPPGITTLLYYANREWSQAHRETDGDGLVPFMRNQVLKDLDHRLGTEIRPEQVLDVRVHRWGLARPETRVEHPFLYDRTLGLGCCGDWDDGCGAQAAYLSGRALARAMVK